MRLSVECGGFTQAADACRTANQTAALLTESLTAKLADCAGMAGNDASSAEFANAYDAGAREAIDALADLTHAFIGAGRLLAATGDNHAAAEAASAGLTVAAYVGGSLDGDSFVRISPTMPPSSLGAQEPSLGRVDAWILDQIEGFIWPGADVSLLRGAGSAWRRCASSVAGLIGEVDAAIALLGHQRSPEVPIAVAALEELAVVIGDTAWQLDLLASACDEYAAAVEEVHERTLALLEEIAQMAVEGAVISVVVTGLTGGLGGGVAAGATLARIRAYAPRFHALLLAFRGVAAASAARLRGARDELAAVRARVEKFLRVPARSERGSMKNPLGWGLTRKPGWLAQHEMPPGHTIARHVGRTVEELAERCRVRSLDEASSFASQDEAERLIDEALTRSTTTIDEWLATGTDKKLELDVPFNRSTGTTVTADGTVTHPTTVRVVLIPSKTQPDGWQILTAFPG